MQPNGFGFVGGPVFGSSRGRKAPRLLICIVVAMLPVAVLLFPQMALAQTRLMTTAPTNLQVVPGNGSLTLTWQWTDDTGGTCHLGPASNGIDPGFEIQYKKSSAAWRQPHEIDSSAPNDATNGVYEVNTSPTRFTIGSNSESIVENSGQIGVTLENGVSYDVRIAAISSVDDPTGVCPQSSWATVIGTSPTVVSVKRRVTTTAPANLQVMPGNGSLALTWQWMDNTGGTCHLDPVTNGPVPGFELQYRRSSAAWRGPEDVTNLAPNDATSGVYKLPASPTRFTIDSNSEGLGEALGQRGVTLDNDASYDVRIAAISSVDNSTEICLQSPWATVIASSPNDPTVAEEVEIVEHTLAAFGTGLLRNARQGVGRRLELETLAHTSPPMPENSAVLAQLDGWLREGEFALPLNSTQDDTGGGWVLWGSAGHVDFEDEPNSDSGHDGEMETVWLGADKPIGDDTLAGLALAYSEGDADYHFMPSAASESRAGNLALELTSIHPYMLFHLDSHRKTWVILGYGEGDLKQESAEKTTETNLDMWMAMAGMRQLLPSVRGVQMVLVGDAGFVTLETDAIAEKSSVSDLSVDVRQMRLGVEFEMLGAGSLRPFGGTYARYDGGDGAEGAGLELSGGFRMSNPSSRFALELEGHWLAMHSDGDYEEWGASLTAAVLPASTGRGLSWSVSTRWGANRPESGVLWSQETVEREWADRERELSLQAQANWGLGLGVEGEVLVPFAQLELDAGELREMKLGMRYRLPSTRHALLELSMGRHASEEIRNYIGVEFRLNY